MDINKLIWNNESRAGSIGDDVSVITSKNVIEMIKLVNESHSSEISNLVDKIEDEVINSTSVMFRPHLSGVFAVIREQLEKEGSSNENM